MQSTVSKKIKYYRECLGWSQERLALEADLDPSFVGRIERGQANPTVSTVGKIIDAMGVSVTEFFDEKDTQEVEPAFKRIEIQLKSLSSKERTEVADIITKIVDLSKGLHEK